MCPSLCIEFCVCVSVYTRILEIVWTSVYICTIIVCVLYLYLLVCIIAINLGFMVVVPFSTFRSSRNKIFDLCALILHHTFFLQRLAILKGKYISHAVHIVFITMTARPMLETGCGKMHTWLLSLMHKEYLDVLAGYIVWVCVLCGFDCALYLKWSRFHTCIFKV